jgi:hypothetical protein
MADYTGLLSGLAEGIKTGTASYQDARKTKLLEEQALNDRKAKIEAAQQEKVYRDQDLDIKRKTLDQNRMEEQNKNVRELGEKGFEAQFDPATPGLLRGAKRIPGFKTPQTENQITAGLLREERMAEMKRSREEKDLATEVPGIGRALTPDDAKQLKEAQISKKNFDSKIQEMIDLRKKHGGGSILNRTDVARGKQLSKDLLLEYKNLAKLGVLSQADEAIINAIIPDDPLAFSFAGTGDEDPILNKLTSFKSDSDKNYTSRLQARLRPGQGMQNEVAKTKSVLPPAAQEMAAKSGLSDDEATALIEMRQAKKAKLLVPGAGVKNGG